MQFSNSHKKFSVSCEHIFYQWNCENVCTKQRC